MNRGDMKRARKAAAIERAEAALVPVVDATAMAQVVARVMRAASDRRGSDCTVHAAMLAEMIGPEARIVLGHAAWRVGPGAGDAIAHHPAANGAVQAGGAFMGHAWVELGDWIIDATTWQWEHKLAVLNALDGRFRSVVAWPLEVLAMERKATKSFWRVQQSNKFAAHYEEVPGLERFMCGPVDPVALALAREAYANPTIALIGAEMTPHELAAELAA
jgi:hypothetical protein